MGRDRLVEILVEAAELVEHLDGARDDLVQERGHVVVGGRGEVDDARARVGVAGLTEVGQQQRVGHEDVEVKRQLEGGVEALEVMPSSA